MARFTKGKGWRVIAFLRVPVDVDVAMDILPLEKNLEGGGCLSVHVIYMQKQPCAPGTVIYLY